MQTVVTRSMPADPAVSTDPALLSATEMLRLFARRQLSPVEVLAAVERRIDRLEPGINAFAVRSTQALAAAQESERRWMAGRPIGSLDGVPTTIKDVMNLAGFATRHGSCLSSPEVADDDAPVPLGLKNAGAIILGKTTTTEYGWGGIGKNPHTGVTSNPWDLTRTPGGSSSGAAAAAAAGYGPLHIGTDGGGSIRVPAAWTGLFGLKPTYGLVPQWPIAAFGHVACAGPITRTVTDAALMLGAIAQPDFRDPYGYPGPNSNWISEMGRGVRDMRVALYSTASASYPADAESASACTDAAQALTAAGARVEEVDLPLFDLRDAFDQQWGIALARLVGQFSTQEQQLFDPGLVLLARAHRNATAEAYLDYEIAAARFTHAMAVFHQKFDLLICPTVSTPPPRSELVLDTAEQARWTRWGSWTFPFNISLQPAASVPLGLDANGLPRSVQLISARYRDDTVLRAACELEACFPRMALPPLS